MKEEMRKTKMWKMLMVVKKKVGWIENPEWKALETSGKPFAELMISDPNAFKCLNVGPTPVI